MDERETETDRQTETETETNRQRVRERVSGYFEPSKPQWLISGLKTNFNLSPSYSVHKSLYHKSLFLWPQVKFCPQFRNAKPEKQ